MGFNSKTLNENLTWTLNGKGHINLPRFMFRSKFAIFCSMSSNFCWSSSMLSECVWCNSWCWRWIGSIKCLGSKFPASSSGDLYVISNKITIYKQFEKNKWRDRKQSRKRKRKKRSIKQITKFNWKIEIQSKQIFK